MLTVVGCSALSPFRAQRVVECLPGLLAVRGSFRHFIETSGELSAERRTVLEALLHYGEQQPQIPSPVGTRRLQRVLVAPRPGTVSPWSSKATDIVHAAGLDQVVRVERGIEYCLYLAHEESMKPEQLVSAGLYDPMIQAVFPDEDAVAELFASVEPRRGAAVPVLAQGRAALVEANQRLGMALDEQEVDYLWEQFRGLGRDPTEVELMMFAQANSEHCRHKIFKAQHWVGDQPEERSLFQMIQNTFRQSPQGVVSAYSDNAAVMTGNPGQRLLCSGAGAAYQEHAEDILILMKCETHNHPTAISPFPGAATGSGGEIRDEAATGRGARPKAGLSGFSVSNLRIPDALQPWEGDDYGRPAQVQSPLQIMLEGPLGAAAFNNEFGRPALLGYFRSFEQDVDLGLGPERRGYHKPIMLAGGMGNVRQSLAQKGKLTPGTVLVVLGGPAFLIGLGGGAASSRDQNQASAQLDFASVQRDNPEMQRRCQEVIDQCSALGDASPIVSIHDVGAGGLSNALPELVADQELGGRIELRDVPSAEPGLSPLEIWCNEAQERFVLGIAPERFAEFEELARRERCPYARVGVATPEFHLRVTDRHFGDTPIDLPLSLLFGNTPQLSRQVRSVSRRGAPLTWGDVSLAEAGRRVLSLPTVADKSFLITIGDRSVTGLVCRDQFVGPHQVPVADVALTLADYRSVAGEAMAMGERAPVALLSPTASARLAVAEAITNMMAVPLTSLSAIKLSANWMAAAGQAGEDEALLEAVRTVGMQLCPELGIAIPVGKDSLSMRTSWQTSAGQPRSVVSPLSLVITAFAPTEDATRAVTPQWNTEEPDTELWLLDLGAGKNRLACSALAQVLGQLGEAVPDLDQPGWLKGMFEVVQSLLQEGELLAYHDRSDGGLFATLCEMAFASNCGVDVELAVDAQGAWGELFSEELGAVIQIRSSARDVLLAACERAGLRAGEGHVRLLGRPSPRREVRVSLGNENETVTWPLPELRKCWSQTSYQMRRLRDNPACADQELALQLDASDPGLSAELTFEYADAPRAPIGGRERPPVAILREQGVNGHVEMAAAFLQAGFTPRDVHMSDLVEGRVRLDDFRGIVACGGFSYGDVLGAGQGWAKSILYTPVLREQFAHYFARDNTFALGVCNGCQMLAGLKSLMVGAEHFPRFVQNRSERFEARLSLVRIEPSPSLFLKGMQGAVLPVAVSHGEGRAEGGVPERAAAMRYVDHALRPTESYPQNPNGSPGGVTAVSSLDGRILICMPHPERVFRTAQLSWHPPGWGHYSPWIQMFDNARRFLDSSHPPMGMGTNA